MKGFILKNIVFLLLFLLHFEARANVTSFSTVTNLAFGSLQIPTTSHYITIPSDGSTPTGNYIPIHNNFSNGQYLLIGDPATDNSLSLDIQNITTGSASLTLSNFTGIYDGTTITSFPVSGLTTPDNNGLTLYLGATLTYLNSIAEGSYSMSFTIVINFN